MTELIRAINKEIKNHELRISYLKVKREDLQENCDHNYIKIGSNHKQDLFECEHCLKQIFEVR